MARRQTEKKMDDLDWSIVRSMAENDLNMNAVARQLYYHGNTITGRCNKIMRITGRDPRTFWGLTDLMREMPKNDSDRK